MRLRQNWTDICWAIFFYSLAIYTGLYSADPNQLNTPAGVAFMGLLSILSVLDQFNRDEKLKSQAEIKNKYRAYREKRAAEVDAALKKLEAYNALKGRVNAD